MHTSVRHSLAPLEHLFTFRGRVTEAVNYGKTSLGNRMDVHFKGEATGGKISGKMYGIDYVRIREDGIIEIDVRATLTTDDGVNISVSIEGYACQDTIHDAHVRFMTGHNTYRWLCDKIVIGKGAYKSEGSMEIDYFYSV